MEYLISFDEFNRMNDHHVKFLFSNPKNKHFTIALLNSIFEVLKSGRVVDVRFKDKEKNANYYNDKTSTVDVLVEDLEGDIYNIEFQIKTFTAFINRVLFYWANEYTKLESGQDYDQLKKITSIIFAQYKFFKDADTRYLRSFHVVDDIDPKTKLTDKLHIIIIDIPTWEKLNIPIDNMCLLDMFIAYFSKKTTYETLMKLAKRNEIMAQLFEAQEAYRTNQEYLHGYRTAEDIERDNMSHDNAIRNEGKEEMVINMLKKNMSPDEISELSGFSKSRIAEIKATIQ